MYVYRGVLTSLNPIYRYLKPHQGFRDICGHGIPYPWHNTWSSKSIGYQINSWLCGHQYSVFCKSFYWILCHFLLLVLRLVFLQIMRQIAHDLAGRRAAGQTKLVGSLKSAVFLGSSLHLARSYIFIKSRSDSILCRFRLFHQAYKESFNEAISFVISEPICEIKAIKFGSNCRAKHVAQG